MHRRFVEDKSRQPHVPSERRFAELCDDIAARAFAARERGELGRGGEVDADLICWLRIAIARETDDEAPAVQLVNQWKVDAQWNGLHLTMLGADYDWPTILREHLLYPVLPDWKPTSER